LAVDAFGVMSIAMEVVSRPKVDSNDRPAVVVDVADVV